jgi:uncharacterized protein YjlB
MNQQPETILLVDDGIFPNSHLPVVHYKNAVRLPLVFAGTALQMIFKRNNWTNNWKNGIYTFHHYHSNTHEVIGVYKGQTTLMLGGDNGVEVTIKKGDILIIPAGVAHRNLGDEKQVLCIGGYPEGKQFDMQVGKPGERPQTDRNIFSVRIPDTDPLEGRNGTLVKLWRKADESSNRYR